MQVPASVETRKPYLEREAGGPALPAPRDCRLYLASELVGRLGGKMTRAALLKVARRAVERTGIANIYFHAFEFRGERLALSSYLGRDGRLVVDVGPAPERARPGTIPGRAAAPLDGGGARRRPPQR